MTERFAVADQLTCYYDRPAEPATVHVEARIPGRLDRDVLRASVDAVLAAEPRVRARRARSGWWRSSYYWEFPAHPDVDPLAFAGHDDQPGLDGQRDAFLSQAIPLGTSPPLRLLISSGPAGDALLISAHHACFDGLSCVRLLHDVAREYAGRAQSGPIGAAGSAVSPPPSGSAPPGTSRRRRSVRGRHAGTMRIAPGEGGAATRPMPGYGAALVAWDGLAAAESLRATGASVNDLLITALMLAIGDWNASRGTGGRGRIRITMPVGDRSQAGPDGQWANRSRLTTVTAPAEALGDPRGVLKLVTAQTAHAKRYRGPQVGLASRALATAPVPVAVKDMMLRGALAVAGPLICDTSLVSNLGAISAPDFGTAVANDVWFSTSAHMPRGLSLGAVTAGDRLALTFRYRRALFGRADAAEFASRYVTALDQVVARQAVSL